VLYPLDFTIDRGNVSYIHHEGNTTIANSYKLETVLKSLANNEGFSKRKIFAPAARDLFVYKNDKFYFNVPLT